MQSIVNRKSNTALLLIGATLGVLTAYILDPVSGRRRRSRMKDKGIKVTRMAVGTAFRRVRDVSHRLRGKVYEINRDLRSSGVEVDDMTLLLRVRSQMGHEISHSRSLHVDVHRGTVILSGPVLAAEVERLIACVERVPGVKAVRDQLDVHEQPDHIPGLQGEAPQGGLYVSTTRH
jgi:hypothetical protein